MSGQKLPRWYESIKKEHSKFITAVEELGSIVRTEGPLNEKTSHLIQLAAAAAIRSEGSVHSHVKRALKAGANREEINHTIILLTSIIGFPNVAAALSWANDIIEKE